jgi:hypothetical protein
VLVFPYAKGFHVLLLGLACIGLSSRSVAAEPRAATVAPASVSGEVSAATSGVPLGVQVSGSRAIPLTKSASPLSSRNVHAPLAGDRPGFFAAGSARTVFQEKPRLNEKPPLEYFNVKMALDDEMVEDTEAATVGLPEGEKIDPKKLNSPEAILKAFGSPEEDDLILANESAPESFKGMIAAMQIKDEQLAWKYARRYARRIREMKERTKETVGLIGGAMVREGELSSKSWFASPEYAKAHKLLEQDLEGSGLLDQETTRIESLDADARAFLQKAQDAEEAGVSELEPPAVLPSENGPKSEAQQRAEIRAALEGKVPVDPKGEVLVYFFFKPYERASLEVVPELESVYRAVVPKAGVTFMGMSAETLSKDGIQGFRVQTNTTFPIKNGARLMAEFGIEKTPTVALISPNTGKAVFEDGRKNFIYFDELISLMRGNQ